MTPFRAFGWIAASCVVLVYSHRVVGDPPAPQVPDRRAEARAAAGEAERGGNDDAMEVDPFDPNIARVLTQMKRRINFGRVHPPTQQVKRALRELLAEQPDDDIAWTLATIIQNGLANTDLLFDAPSDSSRSKQVREDPAESYATLSTMLETCFQLAPPNSELSRNSGLALARLQLLQGDWAGMNAVLENLGQSPVPESQRPSLPAPPPDWSNLERNWQPLQYSKRMKRSTTRS